MKMIAKVSSVFVLFIMLTSPAATPNTLPEKYNLDNELEVIEQITTIKAPSCEQVDDQSVSSPPP